MRAACRHVGLALAVPAWICDWVDCVISREGLRVDDVIRVCQVFFVNDLDFVLGFGFVVALGFCCGCWFWGWSAGEGGFLECTLGLRHEVKGVVAVR